MNLKRTTLENLAKVLSLALNIKIEGRNFRHAKFNAVDDNTVVIFWNVLNKFAPTNKSNVVDNVKLYFHSVRYTSISFYCLPRDMSHGSRELLLAFAYLMTKGILDQFIKEKIFNTPIMQDTAISRTSITNRSIKEVNADAFDWVRGKLLANRRLIDELKRSIQKLVTELNNSMCEKTSKPLTFQELLALGKKEYSYEFIYQIEHRILILECYEKFVRMGRIFWEWMNSVREMKADNAPDEKEYKELELFYLVLCGK